MRKFFPFLLLLALTHVARPAEAILSAASGQQAPVAATRPAAQPPGTLVPPQQAPQVVPQNPPQTQAAAPEVKAQEKVPPAGSPPLVRVIQLSWPTQNDQSVVEPDTYLYYIQTRGSRPSEDLWVPYNEQQVLDDFKRLWATGFLDNLWIDVKDVPYPNGVVGKHVTYNMEERQRIKIVDYVGTKVVDQTKIEEKLKEENIRIALDSFVDLGKIQQVSKIVREMLGEKGYQSAKVTHVVKEMPGGPKLVHLTFNIEEGPKVRIRSVDFVGNKAVSDGTLARQMKENKGRQAPSVSDGGYGALNVFMAPLFLMQGALPFLRPSGTYQEAKFEEDAQNVIDYYRNQGYIAARVGQPQLRFLEDSGDKRTRWVQLQIPVTEGERYRVGDFGFDGVTILKTGPDSPLRQMFKLKAGDWYNEKRVRKGLEKAREVYGAAGYFEFTAYPDLRPRDLVAEERGSEGNGPDGAQAAPGQAADTAAQPAKPKPTRTDARPGRPSSPIVDVTLRAQEGKQYFVNRITFVGNTNTRDNVVRRELRLVEGGVFNTEALKFTVKRINQLGYFKTIEGNKEIEVEKTPGVDNKVDVTLKVEEQNRNQVTFGAGVSQFEGFFGNLGFQTSNFLGRGETLSLSLQAGSRARLYQVAFTEPYLFDRAITGGVDIFKREIRYLGAYTDAATGGNIVFGFPLRDFTRMFMTYSYSQNRIKDLNPAFTDPNLILLYPYLADTLLLGDNGKRTISKITPSFVHNTVDQPIFPTSGTRYTASFDFAGLGGNTKFIKPTLEGVWYIKQNARLSLGFRAQAEYITPIGSTQQLPIFEKLWQGGEYSIRGFDIRSVGPRAEGSELVIGGNKSLLFNGEYLISIAGPVRLVLFYDAGQVRDEGQRFAMNQFKTSTGAEVRFFMPVLNVPFRLIFAYNPGRADVLDNNYQPQKKFTFKFAVGSTF
jgi:outer membrane protein insertion porin family